MNVNVCFFFLINVRVRKRVPLFSDRSKYHSIVIKSRQLGSKLMLLHFIESFNTDKCWYRKPEKTDRLARILNRLNLSSLPMLFIVNYHANFAVLICIHSIYSISINFISRIYLDSTVVKK